MRNSSQYWSDEAEPPPHTFMRRLYNFNNCTRRRLAKSRHPTISLCGFCINFHLQELTLKCQNCQIRYHKNGHPAPRVARLINIYESPGIGNCFCTTENRITKSIGISLRRYATRQEPFGVRMQRATTIWIYFDFMFFFLAKKSSVTMKLARRPLGRFNLKKKVFLGCPHNDNYMCFCCFVSLADCPWLCGRVRLAYRKFWYLPNTKTTHSREFAYF